MSWPRLTETLATVDWGCCQECGANRDGVVLKIWMEHDDQDKVESRAVVLCVKCSDMIEAHPRLYRQEGPDVPCPGVMTMCEDCKCREGYLCRHPDLRLMGGVGLAITYPKPATALVNRGRSGGGCGRVRLWTGRPTECAGRETLRATREEC